MGYMSGGRTRIPIRDAGREMASSGSGPVKSWKMSPEELEDYRARTGYKAPKHPDGHDVVQPVQHGANRQQEEVKTDMGRSKGPDKQKFLELIAEGDSIMAAEKKLGLKPNGMYYWLKKWDLIGIDPGKARAVLAGEPTLLRSTSPAAQAVEARAQGLPAINDSRADAQIKELTEKLRESYAAAEKLQYDNKKLHEELAAAKAHVADAISDRDTWRNRCDELKQAITELEEERALLLQTIESATIADQLQKTAADVSTAVDNVHSPAHYTAGGIETIDFIRAKLTPEEFLGYCKGNALKYVSRATHKGGTEDLHKAGVYLGWAVGGER